MDAAEVSVMRQVHALVDEVRAQCLWFLREDYYPTTAEDACRVLETIERSADLAAFRRASALRRCLSQTSRPPSAA